MDMDMMITSSSSQQVPGGKLRLAAAAGHYPLQPPLKCPRCDSTNTKFCYYNNYSLSQPRHYCKVCKRYWTRGGTLRNVPVGGGCRKNKRLKKPPSVSPSAAVPTSAPYVDSTTTTTSTAAAASTSPTPANLNPFFYTLSAGGPGKLQIPQVDSMGIGEFRSNLQAGQSVIEIFHECSLPTLQDYSLVTPKMDLTSCSWSPLYQSLQTSASAGGSGMVREIKNERRFEAPPLACGENQPGILALDGNPFWNSAISSLWSSEPTSFFGSLATTPLL